jgi:glycosyltransferase involved in cell wall biosynthesis
VGLAYYEACVRLSESKFDDVFILPWMIRGGADKYILNIIKTISDLQSHRRILVFFAEPAASHVWLDKLPPTAQVVDIPSTWPELSSEETDLLIFKIVQHFAPTARIHVRQSGSGERFYSMYKSYFTNQRSIFYRFCDQRYFFEDHQSIEPWGYKFLLNNIDDLDAVIVDNKFVIETDCDRLGIGGAKWHCVYSPQLVLCDAVEREQKLKSFSYKILWAERMTRQKRPEILLELGRQLEKHLPNMTIDVYGTFDAGYASLLDGSSSNLVYRGHFLETTEITQESYLCLIFTSFFEGLPITLLEAAAAGIPIIAPDVGGIGEFVVNEVAGLLLPSVADDATMAKRYVCAIERMLNEPGLRARMIDGAIDRLRANHSPETHRTSVARALAMSL